MKVREETESVLPAPEARAITSILERLGLRQVFRYQKYRTTWQLRGLHLALDETPIGTFLELEGDPDVIDAVAGHLGYTPDEYIASSYRDLYLMKRIDTPGHENEMVFQGD